MPPESGPFFLHKKFRDLNTSPEVEGAARRTKGRTKKELPLQQPDARIQNYLDRLKETFDRPDAAAKERGLNAFKAGLHDAFVLKYEDIPESYFDAIVRRHKEEGRPLEAIPEEIRRELAQTLITDQKRSLDIWIDYIATPDAKYPGYLKYFAIRSMLNMGVYDKQKKKFNVHRKGTVSPFPDLNRDALSFVLDAMEKMHTGREQDIYLGWDVPQEDKTEFSKSLHAENFSKMYAYAHEHFKPVPKELLLKTRGQWKTFPKGSEPMSVVKAIEKYSTGWCLRGEATARRYLTDSDLIIFFSDDEKDEPTIPRAVIVMKNGRIDEVRGIAPGENTDPHIGDVVASKLLEFPDGKAYEKRSQDMRRLTMIDDKSKVGESLTRDDLIFLYEVDAKIEGFWYGDDRDRRIKELLLKRNPKEDAPIVFGCQPDEIAWKKEDVTERTKAYVGQLFPGIFKIVGHLERLYTSLPEGKITRYNVEIGGQTEEQLEATLNRTGFKISDYASYMKKQKEFKTAKDPEQVDLIRLRVQDLFGDQNNHTTDDIYKRADQLGLELCPAEVGPYLRLKLTDQLMGEGLRIAMKPIPDPSGSLLIFNVGRNEDGSVLLSNWAEPNRPWDPRDEFVFRLRK